MARRVVVIPCGDKKVAGVQEARRLYVGQYFVSMHTAACSLTSDRNVFILSAKHGLLALDTKLVAYSTKMGDADAIDQRAGGKEQLVTQIQRLRLHDEQTEVLLLLPTRYRDTFMAAYTAAGGTNATNLLPGNMRLNSQRGIARAIRERKLQSRTQ